MALRRTFLQSERQSQFTDRGTAQLRLLDTRSVNDLRAQVLTEYRGTCDGWHSSNESTDHSYRRALHKILAPAFTEALAHVLDNHRLINTALLVKWPGTDGAMTAHQDWTFVDESRFRSLTVWCPLVDVGPDNGALQVLPGSHRILDHIRCSPSLPDSYENPIKLLKDADFENLPMAAGTAVALDHGLVHRSPPNMSASPRVAVAAAFAPMEAPLQHHHRSEGTDTIFSFAVPNPSWFHAFDIGDTPEGLRVDRRVEFNAPSVSADNLVASCKSATADTPPPEGETRSQVLTGPPIEEVLGSGRSPTLADPALEQDFLDHGYTVVDLLDDCEIESLRHTHGGLDHPGIGENPFAEGFHTTMYDPRPEYRTSVFTAIEEAMHSALESLLVNHRMFFANFTVKVPGGGPVPCHLDWTFIDESAASSATIWCALEDLTAENGALGVFPGSHRTVDFVRPVNHRDYDRHASIMGPEAQRHTIPLRAGQAIVMDNRTVHFSPPNRSSRIRIAAAGVVAPTHAALHHYWLDEHGSLVRFEVTPDFYLHYEIGENPGGAVGVIGRSIVADVTYA